MSRVKRHCFAYALTALGLAQSHAGAEDAALPATFDLRREAGHVQRSVAADLNAATPHETGARPVAPGAGTGSRSVRDSVRWLGRVDDRAMNAPTFGWSHSGFEVRFKGSELRAKLLNGMDYYFLVVLDGAPLRRFHAAWGLGVYTLASGLSEGEHTLALIRESEGQYGPTTLLGFDGAELLAPGPARARAVEVIGDSVACGYGVLEVEHHLPDRGAACHYSFLSESAFHGFAGLTARVLDADLSVVAVSGWGVFRGRDHGHDKNLPSVYERVVADQAASKWDFRRAPDAVVIALGANDIAPPAPSNPGEANFLAAYRALLKRVRKRYPGAWIVCTTSPTLSDAYPPDVKARTLIRTWIQRVVGEQRQTGDARVSELEFPPHDKSTTGCDWHPSLASHRSMSELLARELRDRLGW